MRRLLMPAIAWASLLFSAAAEPETRSLDVTVLRPDGKPAPGAIVDLIGIDRSNLHNSFEPDNAKGPAPAPPWRTKTDAKGLVHISLNCARATDDVLPGWGPYYLVARDEANGTAVSPRIVHMEADAAPYYLESFRTEWNANPVILKKASTSLTLQLKRGLRLKGRVVDSAGKPVADRLVDVCHNLGAGTHTGYGGEILQRTAVTDAKGDFVLNGIYPNAFVLSIPQSREMDQAWAKTILRGKTSALPVDEIAPLPGEKEIAITCVVSRDGLYRYEGTITAADGHPIPDAQVTYSVSKHKVPNYSDSHGFSIVETDAKGHYSFSCLTPFVRYIQVEAEGYEGTAEDSDEGDGKFLTPGKHSYRLDPIKK